MNIHIRIDGGTPAEISDVLRALPGTSMVHTAAVELTDEVVDSSTTSESLEEASRFVTTRFARRALKRLKLSKPMKKVLTALYEAETERLPLATLQDVAGYSPAQFAGLMGAFGRRLANTEGFDSEAEFFEYDWDEDEETWTYRLPETVREALALEQLV